MPSLLERPDVDLLPRVRDFASGTRPMLIGEDFVEAIDGRVFDTIDPATGAPLTQIAEAGPQDVDLAVRAARAAFEGPWRRTPAAERARLLNRLADLIQDNAEELAQLESLDTGKPLVRAREDDIPFAIDAYRYFAGWPRQIEGQTIPVSVPDAHVYTRMEPVGVVGAIVAWNFPMILYAWKLAPALAAGCTVVLKPAEQTPLTALRLGELALEAGFPPGVVNVCPGVGEIAGRALVRHPGVDAIAFTGSTEVGREIVRAAADTLKHVSLELGGKSPNIVFADADLGAAAATAAFAIFWGSGQACAAGSRLMVQREAYDEVVEAVVREARALRMGPGVHPETTLGPLVSQEQLERVTGYIAAGVDAGAGVAVGGRRAGGELAEGYFVEPTVLTDVADELTVCREEIFGPVLVAQPFDTLEEVAARANATPYGLVAAVWTSDLRRGHKLAAMLDAGTVWINAYHAYDSAVPFGGFKQWGYGRDMGRASLEKYLQVKSVWTNLA
jgi:acyl-CoA reductase-like NAD-dependent aldehyde dehydrogenase